VIYLRPAFLLLTITGTIYYVLSTIALARHFRRTGATKAARAEHSVSILKPISGLDPFLEDDLRSFLDTGREVLIGVLEHEDPSVQVLQRLILDYPNASLHVGAKIDGANNKVRILDNLARRAGGEILLITDADTRAHAGLIDSFMAPFAETDVGAVTCLYKAANAHSLGDAIEALHMTCIFAPGVACHNALWGIDFGLGAAIAVRAETLQEAGGFAALADYLADDFQLGRLIAKAGQKVILSREVIGVQMGGQSLRSALERDLRWSVTTRVSRPFGHFGLIFTFGFAYALAYLALSGFSPRGWVVALGVGTIRASTAWLGAVNCMGDTEFWRGAFLLPLRDVLSFATWVGGYFVRSVKWRGRRLRVLRHGKVVVVGKKVSRNNEIVFLTLNPACPNPRKIDCEQVRHRFRRRRPRKR